MVSWRGLGRRRELPVRALTIQKEKGKKPMSSICLDEGQKFLTNLLHTKQDLWIDRSGCSVAYTTLLSEHMGLLTVVEF